MHPLPLILAAALFAQTAPSQPPVRASRATTPPIVDGRLDEAVWESADVAENFRQLEPDEGQPATERTEVRILYDNNSLYVGVRLFDSGDTNDDNR